MFDLLVILGPTASGKTHLGVELARRLDGEILSADSRQIYRGMDLGTGKDLGEYGEIPYHLIDIVDAGEEFNVFAYQRCFYEALEKIRARGRSPIMVGGTGLYLEAVIRGYRLVQVPENLGLRRDLALLSHEALVERLRRLRPALHNTTDLVDRERLVRAIEIAEGEQQAGALGAIPQLHPRIFGVYWPRDVLRRRITERLRARLDAGLVDEVERLLASGVSYERLELYGLEYRFVARYVRGELNRNDMFQKLNSAIHQFAKRQETWFRRMERQGVSISWVDGAANPVATVLAQLE